MHRPARLLARAVRRESISLHIRAPQIRHAKQSFFARKIDYSLLSYSPIAVLLLLSPTPIGI